MTTYQYTNCMFMSKAISFEIVWGGLVTEAVYVIEVWGRVIYAGQDNLNPYRKRTLLWGQQTVRHLLDLPYEIHVSD